MGFRFRKSISLGKGVRLNISKRGLGVSAGVKGARVGIGPRGVRKTYSIPGTGISHVEERSLGSTRTKNSPSARRKANSLTPSTQPSIPNQSLSGTNWVWGIIIGFILIFSQPVLGVPLMGISVYFFRKKMQEPENKSKTAFNQGVGELKKSNIEKASTYFESSLEYDNTNHMARLLMTNIAFSQEKYELVLANLKILPSTVFDDPSIVLVAAVSYFSIKQYDSAIPLLQQLNTIEEYKDEANIILGRCFLEKEMYDLAVEQLRKGPVLKRTMTPTVMEAKYWLGVTYYKLDQKKKASTQFNTLYAEDINYKDVKEYVERLLI